MKKYLKKNVGSLILAIVFAIAYAGAFVGISLLLQEIIDIALAGEIRKAAIISACYIAAFSFVCFNQALTQVRLNQKVAGEIRSTIVGKIIKKDTLSFEKYKGSDYISLVQNDVKKIEDGYIETILSIVSAIAMLVMAVIVMTRYSWVFTAFMFGMTLVMFVVPTIFTKKLSGGQKQRIAIARALFADRDIIVLDEGISALDKETALEIEDTLLKRKGQTLISISHHVLPEMRAKYDEIIELKDGTIRIA